MLHDRITPDVSVVQVIRFTLHPVYREMLSYLVVGNDISVFVSIIQCGTERRPAVIVHIQESYVRCMNEQN
jgi:hypothetical protein